MRLRAVEDDPWSPRLATFNADDWAPAPGDLEQDCGCPHCRERFGPPKPAGNTVTDARRRWRRARLATLTRGSPDYLAEALAAFRARATNGR